jgi:hypothetical protein
LLAVSRPDFAVKDILDDLRAACGDSEFGYRMQALFAHVILRLNGRVIEINAQGHPDIRAWLGRRELLIQVKTFWHRYPTSVFELSTEDVGGIQATGEREGILAVLDCAVPVRWNVVPADRAASLTGFAIPAATLRADSNRSLSEDCTAEFLGIVLNTGDKLRNLTYRLLRRRALRGESI